MGVVLRICEDLDAASKTERLEEGGNTRWWARGAKFKKMGLIGPTFMKREGSFAPMCKWIKTGRGEWRQGI